MGTKMRKVSTWEKLLIIITLMVCVCAMGHLLYRDHAQTGDSASYIDKMDRLEALQGKKAVFVGGSATHFGVQAERFQELTGIPSVNMGLNAGISVGLYLDSIEPFLQAGDVVFITPEYSYYQGELYNCAEADAEFLLYYTKGNPLRINGGGFLKMIQPTLFSGWKNVGSFIRDNLRDRIKKGDTLYLRSNSNEYGDMAGAKDWHQSDIAPVAVDFELGSFAEDLTERVKRLESMDVQVYVCFPPYQDTSYDQSTACIDEIYEELKDEVTLLYQPVDGALLDDQFLDTVYHLTYDGAAEFTQMLTQRFLDVQSEE